jgi:uncharacterized integral membrane protein
MKKIKSFFALILLITIIAVIFQNIETVSVSFLFWNMEVSRALLMLFCFFSGALVTFLFTIGKSRTNKKMV